MNAEEKYLNSLNKENKIIYEAKLKIADGKLPDPYRLASWHQDMKKMPPVKIDDISFYLLYKPSDYTKDSVQNFKSLEASLQFYNAGHVQDVYMHDIQEGSDFSFIKTGV